jgi:hypothetical protein
MSWSCEHPVAGALREAAAGRFPAVDGRAQFVAPDPAGTHAVVSFTGRCYVMTALDADRLGGLGIDGYGGATDPRVLTRLAGEHGQVGSIDVVLVRAGLGGGSPLAERHDLEHHPRVQRARHHRREVRVLGDERGFVTIGEGLLKRTELSVELTESAPGHGAGRRLIMAALCALSVDELVFAQVAPGNAASLRAFLASGFVPIGSEVLIDVS